MSPVSDWKQAIEKVVHHAEVVARAQALGSLIELLLEEGVIEQPSDSMFVHEHPYLVRDELCDGSDALKWFPRAIAQGEPLYRVVTPMTPEPQVAALTAERDRLRAELDRAYETQGDPDD